MYFYLGLLRGVDTVLGGTVQFLRQFDNEEEGYI